MTIITPKTLSIITINLDNAAGLLKTIESVVSQTYKDFEYIVIDGGSKDLSLEVIKKFADKITYWVSEPDKGIFNAMNKGILKATGEYCLFLNSGDSLVDVNVVKDFHSANFKEDIISGNRCIKDRKLIRESPQKKDLNFSFFYNNSLPHSCSFIKRDLFAIYGLYDEKYKIVSDWEFFIKCLVINNCTYNHFDRIISLFDVTGISNQSEMRPLQEEEKDQVLRSIMPSFFYESFKEVWNRKTVLQSHEAEYREYMTLKHGKFFFIIKLLLFLKKQKRNQLKKNCD